MKLERAKKAMEILTKIGEFERTLAIIDIKETTTTNENPISLKTAARIAVYNVMINALKSQIEKLQIELSNL